MLLLLPSKSPFAKSPTDFFAASTRNDATRREERCAIFLLATVLAGAARNANFCADAAANEDMSITLTCVFWRSDAREKCRFPDWICVDYKSQSMMMMMDIYLFHKENHSRTREKERARSFFFLPSFFSSSSGKTHERMKKERLKTTERRFYTFTRGKHTHTHARTPKTKEEEEEEEEQKKEKMPSSDMSLGFLLKYTRLAQKTKTKKKRRRKKYANNKSDDAVLFKKHFRFRL